MAAGDVVTVEELRASIVEAFVELDDQEPAAPWSDFADAAMTRCGHFLLVAGASSPESDVVPLS